MIDGIDPMPNPYDPKYNYFNKDANHSYDRRILNISYTILKLARRIGYNLKQNPKS